MILKNYKKNLFQDLSESVVIEFDKETKQYCVINDNTPGIYWIWDTKEEAVSEYLSSLKDMILIDDSIKDETYTVA